MEYTDMNYTICFCNHLTHFGVLLDLARTEIDVTHDHILTLTSYAGCGASSLFLGITLMTYLTLEKVRRDNPSKILLNLCAALLMLNFVFLTNSWLTSFNQPGLCITMAMLLLISYWIFSFSIVNSLFHNLLLNTSFPCFPV